jgi:hypothetical protein
MVETIGIESQLQSVVFEINMKHINWKCLGFAQTKAGGNRAGELSALFDSPMHEMLTVMCVCNKAQFEDEETEKKQSVLPMNGYFLFRSNSSDLDLQFK